MTPLLAIALVEHNAGLEQEEDRASIARLLSATLRRLLPGRPMFSKAKQPSIYKRSSFLSKATEHQIIC